VEHAHRQSKRLQRGANASDAGDGIAKDETGTLVVVVPHISGSRGHQVGVQVTVLVELGALDLLQLEAVR